MEDTVSGDSMAATFSGNSMGRHFPPGSQDAWSLCWWINNIDKNPTLPSPWKIAWQPDIVGKIFGDYSAVLKNSETGQYALVVQGTQFHLFNFDVWQDLDINNWVDFQPVASAKVAIGVANGVADGEASSANSALVRMLFKNLDNGGVNLSQYLTTYVSSWTKHPLLVTGHSLGGTLASVAAAWIAYKFLGNSRGSNKLPATIQAITFAAFAGGNQAFAEFLNNSSNYVPCFNKNDLVPHLWATDTTGNPLFNVSNACKLFPSGPPMGDLEKGAIDIIVGLMQKNGVSYVQTTRNSFQFAYDSGGHKKFGNEVGYQHNDAYKNIFGS